MSTLIMTIGILFLTQGEAVAEKSSGANKNHKKLAQASFNELSDISRNVDNLLEETQKSGDQEQVQCISSRQASIKALKDISEQARFSVDSSVGRTDFVRADNELRKITVSLNKAQQYAAEAQSCMSSFASSQGENQTNISVETEQVADIMEGSGNAADFGMDNIEALVDNMESEVSTSTSSSSDNGASSSSSSGALPPPPPSSPVE